MKFLVHYITVLTLTSDTLNYTNTVSKSTTNTSRRLYESEIHESWVDGPCIFKKNFY